MVLCSILLVLIAESSEGPPHVTASNRRDATWNRRSIGKDRFISRLVHALLGLEWEVAGLLFIGLRYSLRSIKTTRPRADELRSLIATDNLHSYFAGKGLCRRSRICAEVFGAAACFFNWFAATVRVPVRDWRI